MKKGLIYCLICPISKEYKYVGKTTSTLSKRLASHKSDCLRHNTYKDRWLRKIKRLNLLSHVQIILIETMYFDDNINVLNEREIYFKDKGLKLTNTTIGGEGTYGYKHTAEALRKISDAGKLRKGEKRSLETCKRISESLRGKLGRNTGNKHSQITKDKISKTKQGCIPPNRKQIKQLTKKGSLIKIWESTHQAANDLKLNQGNISQVATGIRKSCGGFVWLY